jgi:hypothetical protein
VRPVPGAADVGRGESLRPAVLVFLLLAALGASLQVRASLASPPGTVFVGTLYYSDDFYNYLSYVEQAERGAFVFRNKLASPRVPPALVNLEWLAVGWLSALLGGAPILAYHLAGLGALAVLVALADRWLVRSGLPDPARLPGLLLVFTGGGLGGLLFVTGLLPVERALDLRTGAFPFVAALANPHFVIGTALLACALALFASDRGGRAAVVGAVLGLVRPYDAALLVGIEALAVVLSRPAREWPRRLLPVAAILPVLAYDAWLFLAGPGFRVFSSPRYAQLAPRPSDLLVALGPALLVALGAWRAPATGEARPQRLRLALWSLLAVAIVALHPVSFSLQFIVGIGLPLLVLGAVGLCGLSPRLVVPAVPVMATTAVVAVLLCMIPSPTRDVPIERWRIARALRATCRPGDVVLAPPDIGLLVGGLTPCWPYVSHGAAPEYEARAEVVRRFYGQASPEERRRLLDEACAEFVVLPPGPPDGWLGGAPFRERLAVRGPRGGLAVFGRAGAAPACAAPVS